MPHDRILLGVRPNRNPFGDFIYVVNPRTILISASLCGSLSLYDCTTTVRATLWLRLPDTGNATRNVAVKPTRRS